MLLTQIEKLGNSFFIKLPEKDGKKLEINKEYFIDYKDNGIIILIPKLEDPFKKAKLGEFYEKDIWEKLIPIGEEL